MPNDKPSGHRPGANAHGLGPDTAPAWVPLCPKCGSRTTPCGILGCPLQDTPAPGSIAEAIGENIERRSAPEAIIGNFAHNEAGEVRAAGGSDGAPLLRGNYDLPNGPRSIVQKGDEPGRPSDPNRLGDSPRPAPTEQLLQFFEYGHLPEKLQTISRPFSILAHDLVAVLPRNPERTVALRKLLEAKDCAVRSMVFKS